MERLIYISGGLFDGGMVVDTVLYIVVYMYKFSSRIVQKYEEVSSRRSGLELDLRLV